MKAYILILIMGLILLPLTHAVIVIVINPPTTGSQIFFDDFTQSQFPTQWNGYAAGTSPPVNNVTENNGYLILTVGGGYLSPIGTISVQVEANQTGPAIGSLTPTNIQFRQVTMKMQPFNMTGTPYSVRPANKPLIGEVWAGLSNVVNGILGLQGMYFYMIESTTPLSTIDSHFPSTRTAIYFSVNKPMASATSTYYRFIGGSAGTNDGILYQPAGTQQFDLNQMHLFTFQTQIDKSNATNTFVRWQVDNNGWMILWQTGCSCITGASGDIQNLYPALDLVYTDVGTCPAPQCVASQSLASQIDYFLVVDYSPQSLPTGQILISSINPPLHNQGIYQPGGFSLTQYVQFEANNMGQGNIYAGGLFLTGIFLLIITLGLAGVMWRTRMGLAVFGMIWDISTLAFIYLMFYCGVIPLLVPVLVTIGATAILFGIFRSGPPAMGGEISS